jgi:hypothetical protein
MSQMDSRQTRKRNVLTGGTRSLSKPKDIWKINSVQGINKLINRVTTAVMKVNYLHDIPNFVVAQRIIKNSEE